MKIRLVICLFFLLLARPLRATTPPDERESAQLAREAYVFGYPLLVMESTKRKMIAPSEPGDESRINRFSHMRVFPDATFIDVVSPNADTLYSFVWMDLKTSPMVLRLPDTGDRYYLMQFLDGWTNNFVSLGSRTTGNRPGVFLITGPDWDGEVPGGMHRVQSPTNMVWILGRTQTNGIGDYAAVHAIQDQYSLRPLLETPAARIEPVDLASSPMEWVESLDAAAFYAQLNRLMADNPPRPEDKPLLDRLAAISIGPGLAFDTVSLPENVVRTIESGHAAARAEIAGLGSGQFGRAANGWNILPEQVGRFGTDYRMRAFIARFGLGANLPEDAVYPTIGADSDGQPLSGANRYAIRFAPGRLPPVNAFWSVTMYNDKQRFVDNPIGRYAIGDRDPLVPHADGGLTLYVRHAPPEKEKQANWLPAPKGEFNMIMRLYWPKQSVLDGSWPLPILSKDK